MKLGFLFFCLLVYVWCFDFSDQMFGCLIWAKLLRYDFVYDFGLFGALFVVWSLLLLGW